MGHQQSRPGGIEFPDRTPFAKIRMSHEGPDVIENEERAVPKQGPYPVQNGLRRRHVAICHDQPDAVAGLSPQSGADERGHSALEWLS